MALNRKYQMFIDEYMANGYNASAAYHAINPNCTRASAGNHGYRLIKENKEIKEEIDRRIKDRFDTLNISAERIAEELAQMAFACKGDEDYTAQVKLKALDLLQKQLGLQQQKVNAKVETISIDVSVEDED